MTEYGATDNGFILKRLTDIITDMKASLSQVQDPKTGESLTPDLLDENDPLILVINSFAAELSTAWENLQLAYNQFDPQKATGAGLSGVVQLNGIRRAAGSFPTVSVTITGTAGTSLPDKRQITTMAGSPIFELPALVIGAGGTSVAIAIGTEEGPFVALAGEVVKILTPVTGWDSVTNGADAIPGSLEETDAELQAKQRNRTSLTAQTAVESIAAGVGNLYSVLFVKMYQNITLVTDSRGIPAKTIAPIIVGGVDDDIAQVLFDKIAAGGCDTFGSTEIDIIDENGISYPMRFSRPTNVPVYIDIDITVVDPLLWPAGGTDKIKAAILAFAQLGADAINIPDEYDQGGYSPGQSVYASEMSIPIYTVPGIKVNTIFADTTASPVADEATISWDEIATFDSANINITGG